MRFTDILNDELKDPEFRQEYEKASAEEDAKLHAAMADARYHPVAYKTADGTVRQWRYADDELPGWKDGEPVGPSVCYDCRKLYGHFTDIKIPDELWERINPTAHRGAGTLCPNCIFERLHELGVYEVFVS